MGTKHKGRVCINSRPKDANRYTSDTYIFNKIQQNFHEIQVNQTQIFMKRIKKHQETLETR